MKNRLSYFNTRALFCGIGLSYILKVSNTSIWLTMSLGILIGIAIILTLSKLSIKQNKISNFIISIISTVILVNSAGTLYLENTPNIHIIIFTIIVIYLAANVRGNNLIKVCELLLPISVGLFLVKAACLIPYVDLDNFKPILNSSIFDIIKSAVCFAIISTVPAVLLNTNVDKRDMVHNYILSVLTVLVTGVLVVGVLGINESILYRYPEYVVLKRIRMLDFFYNVENIFSFALIADLFITSVYSLKQTFTEQKSLNWITQILLGALVFFICSRTQYAQYLYDYLPYVLLLLLIMSIFPKKNMHINMHKEVPY